MDVQKHDMNRMDNPVQNAANCAASRRPQYVVFAGVNGAGKTTLIQ